MRRLMPDLASAVRTLKTTETVQVPKKFPTVFKRRGPHICKGLVSASLMNFKPNTSHVQKQPHSLARLLEFQTPTIAMLLRANPKLANLTVTSIILHALKSQSRLNALERGYARLYTCMQHEETSSVCLPETPRS